MRGGDYRQADGSLQNTTNDIRSDCPHVMQQVPRFLNHSSPQRWQRVKRSLDYLVGSIKSNQTSCRLTTSTNVPKRSKREDVEYR